MNNLLNWESVETASDFNESDLMIGYAMMIPLESDSGVIDTDRLSYSPDMGLAD